MDDVDFYLKISESLSEIMRQVRFYPYPAVLYKMAFNKYLQWDGEEINVKVEKKNDKKSESKVEKKEESKEEKTETHKVKEKKQEMNSENNWELWEHVIKQIQSSTTRQVFKEHVTIDKISNTEVFLIHDNNMVAKTLLEKETKEIEDLLEKELGKKVTLTIKWMSKEEYFQRLMWI